MATIDRAKIEQQILEMMPTTVDAAALQLAEGKSHLLSPIFTELHNRGIIKKTGVTKRTSNGGYASEYDLSARFETKIQNVARRFSRDTHTVFIMKVTYRDALIISTHLSNEANRDTKPGKVKEWAAAMEAGLWNPCSMLMFAKNGTLLDGHNRLEAQVKSKTDQTYVVQLGCEAGWLGSVDIGAKRSTKDTAQMVMRCNGKDVNKKAAERLSSIALHLLQNRNSEEVQITGSGSPNTVTQRFVDANIDVLFSILKEFDTLIDDRKFSDFKDMVTKSSIKRSVICAISEMFIDNPTYAREFIEGVFVNRNCDTFVTVYNELKSLRDNKVRKDRERATYYLLVNAYRLLKLGQDRFLNLRNAKCASLSNPQKGASKVMFQDFLSKLNF